MNNESVIPDHDVSQGEINALVVRLKAARDGFPLIDENPQELLSDALAMVVGKGNEIVMREKYVAANEQGSKIIANLFNDLTEKQKANVNKDTRTDLIEFMTKNGYGFVFDKWYKQHPPSLFNDA